MKKKKLSALDIALMGILLAMQIIFTRFFAIETPFVRISFLFIPTFIMAILFGPLLTGAGTAISDFIGILLFSKGAPFFPGFTISAFLSGFIYGKGFYKKEVTWKRVLVVNLIISIFIDLLLNTCWLYLMMGPGVIGHLPVRIAKTLILYPVYVVIMYSMGKQKIVRLTTKKYQF